MSPAIHAAQHERAGHADADKRDRLYRRPVRAEQPAAAPSYTVSPAGQPLKHSRPAPGAAQAVGRHMTKGQRAMAVAMIWPKPRKLRRKGSSASATEGLTAERLSTARTVLASAPNEAAEVLAGTKEERPQREAGPVSTENHKR